MNNDVAHFVVALTFADDGYVTQPLWNLAPRYRLALLHERRVRGVLLDDEPAGDPEYA
ncbi:hypothetical protein ACFPA8_07840 [Streptomyces ovatisporus]|uniref:Uncharacterized protein n=1 Tax=Streptomyces ovatisporus TaxID=1128682 RepID=A0ABV9A3J5_9ACTN